MTTSLEFAELVRDLGAIARRRGLAVPGYRSPPQGGALRSIRRRPDGGATVAVRLAGRALELVAADVVAGLVHANGRPDLEAELLAALLDGREPAHDARRDALEADRPLPGQRHSETSMEAAEAARPNAGTQRARVLEWLEGHGPATDEQIADALAMNPSAERPRRVELVEAGLVVDAGKATTRSGRRAVLWAAVG